MSNIRETLRRITQEIAKDPGRYEPTHMFLNTEGMTDEEVARMVWALENWDEFVALGDEEE